MASRLASAVLGLAVTAGSATAQTGSSPAPASPAAIAAANASPEYAVLFRETLRRPGDAALAVRFARAAVALGDVEAAIGAYERVLFYDASLAPMRFELGVLYHRLGSYESARTYFRTALAAGTLPPAAAARAEAFLAEIDGRVSAHAWSVYAQTGLRWQSNANAAPSSVLVRALGEPGLLDRRFARRSDGSVFALGTARHVFDFETQRGDTWETTLQGYASRQFEVTRSNIALVEVQTGPRLALAPDALPGVGVRPYVLAGAAALGNDPYLTSLGLGFGLMLPLGPGAGLEPFVETRERRFARSEDYPNAPEQTGRLVTAGVAGFGDLWGPVRWQARAAYRRGEARNDAYAFDALGLELSLPFEFDGPFGGRRWQLTPAVSVQRLAYDAPNPLVDPSRRRRDTELRVGATLDVPVSDRFGIAAQLQYSTIRSNLPNYDTDNVSISVGPTVRF
jgi:tetratricopeptide (TPR) repeat protein